MHKPSFGVTGSHGFMSKLAEKLSLHYSLTVSSKASDCTFAQ